MAFGGYGAPSTGDILGRMGMGGSAPAQPSAPTGQNRPPMYSVGTPGPSPQQVVGRMQNQPSIQGGGQSMFANPWQGYQQPSYGPQAPYWQPQQVQQQMPQYQAPQAPQMMNAQRSIEQQALAGGTNAQQTQNFLQALRLSGAGGNNAFASGTPAQRGPVGPLIGGPMGNNASNGMASYAGGFNPQGGGNSYYGLSPTPNGGVTYGDYSQQQMANGGLMQQQQAPWQQQTQAGGSYTQPDGFTNMMKLGAQDFRAQAGTGQDLYNRGTLLNQAFQKQAQQDQAAPPQQSQVNNFFKNTGLGGNTGGGNLNLGGFWAASDENLKTDIEPGDKDIVGMLGELGVHSYEYKDPKHGEGRFVSPMAQELEKTELGKSAVVETKEGKMVNYGRLGGITLAAAAMHEKRIAALEKALKLKGGKGG